MGGQQSYFVVPYDTMNYYLTKLTPYKLLPSDLISVHAP